MFAAFGRYAWLAAAFVCVVAHAAPMLDPGFVPKVAGGLLKVEAYNADGSTNLGSAVIVGRGVAVSNCHVIARSKDVSLVRGAERWPVFEARISAERDLCLLYSHGMEGAPIPLSSDSPRIGQTVVAVGFPGGVGPRVTVGAVKALYDFDGGKVIQSTSAFASGSSGGALFDVEGQLLGIVTFKSRAGSAFHFSLPVAWVREELLAPRTELPTSGSISPAFWQRPTAAQPFFLRANLLEGDREWQQLAHLSESWIEGDKRDANAWLTRGKAQLRLLNAREAVVALKESIRLDHDNSEAWYHLGLAHAVRGEMDDVMDCYRRLLPLSEDTAALLSRDTGLCKQGQVVSC